MSLRQLCVPLSTLVLIACDASTAVDPGVPAPSFASGSQVVGHANGTGVVNVGVPMSFEFNALLRSNGTAHGEAFHHAPLGDLVIEFRTRVTCVSIDPVNNRAWIGGVITENNSTDPARSQERNQVGRDIWWRVVDYGNGMSGTVDRSTFLGFTGDANIQTSAEYCAVRPWPGPPTDPVDARTAPVTEGNISVRLR